MKTTFCCCIKTRLGVLLMAPITCLLAIASTVISIYGLVHFWHDISIWQRIFWCSLSAMTSILALASVYGFVGAIVKSHNSVNVYANAMYSLWISLTASGILSFIFLLKDQEDVIDACIHTERQSDYWCKKAFRLSAAVTFVLWAIIVVMGLFLLTIVRRYARQLAEEQREGTYPRPLDPVRGMQPSQSYRSEDYQERKDYQA